MGGAAEAEGCGVAVGFIPTGISGWESSCWTDDAVTWMVSKELEGRGAGGGSMSRLEDEAAESSCRRGVVQTGSSEGEIRAGGKVSDMQARAGCASTRGGGMSLETVSGKGAGGKGAELASSAWGCCGSARGNDGRCVSDRGKGWR